jgi:hypothetical protein
MNSINYEAKYLKYKNKYLQLKKLEGGNVCNDPFNKAPNTCKIKKILKKYGKFNLIYDFPYIKFINAIKNAVKEGEFNDFYSCIYYIYTKKEKYNISDDNDYIYDSIILSLIDDKENITYSEEERIREFIFDKDKTHKEFNLRLNLKTIIHAEIQKVLNKNIYPTYNFEEDSLSDISISSVEEDFPIGKRRTPPIPPKQQYQPMLLPSKPIRRQPPTATARTRQPPPLPTATARTRQPPPLPTSIQPPPLPTATARARQPPPLPNQYMLSEQNFEKIYPDIERF